VGFVDLVKAYDTANHALLLCILERYGAPPKFVAAIQTIYSDNICVLKIEKETVKIPQSVGVRQGDNMAPVLFLFLMTAFAETLEIVWKQQEIPVISVMMATGDNMIDGRICSHTLTVFKSKNLTAYEILQCLHVDDGAFLFGTRDDLQKGMNLIYTTLAGLEWKCTSDEEHRCHKLNASSSLPPSSSNTLNNVLRLPQQFRGPSDAQRKIQHR
jgi:hypothetical protein